MSAAVAVPSKDAVSTSSSVVTSPPTAAPTTTTTTTSSSPATAAAAASSVPTQATATVTATSTPALNVLGAALKSGVAGDKQAVSAEVKGVKDENKGVSSAPPSTDPSHTQYYRGKGVPSSGTLPATAAKDAASAQAKSTAAAMEEDDDDKCGCGSDHSEHAMMGLSMEILSHLMRQAEQQQQQQPSRVEHQKRAIFGGAPQSYGGQRSIAAYPHLKCVVRLNDNLAGRVALIRTPPYGVALETVVRMMECVPALVASPLVLPADPEWTVRDLRDRIDKSLVEWLRDKRLPASQLTLQVTQVLGPHGSGQLSSVGSILPLCKAAEVHVEVDLVAVQPKAGLFGGGGFGGFGGFGGGAGPTMMLYSLGRGPLTQNTQPVNTQTKDSKAAGAGTAAAAVDGGKDSKDKVAATTTPPTAAAAAAAGKVPPQSDGKPESAAAAVTLTISTTDPNPHPIPVVTAAVAAAAAPSSSSSESASAASSTARPAASPDS